ncbi:4-hydroxybenzoate polyprenyltransferase [Marinomonas ushuaiensis DSM 15871]|uniref:4-hydroxybenzoate octaprenyltransferase n=1 Tax=Marinomonas ushuaiensis DSM 15871 TaxID=1122207 RepID=X7E805_9GAMM|nr:4-hydroxybenzoate octaprenyltransferase [Marinomonas ushuaiensis]ETX12087.1 4-hydroxybenzoate polyprenyltransferase [Marinomonas ushuaiensis DSM 15871]
MTKFQNYLELTRFNRPIGSLLLMWPTLWALWLASGGMPQWHLVVIFGLGVFSMRSAGCVINDYADRKVDGSVERTKDRPLPSGRVSEKEALVLFAGLCVLSFVLVLFTDMRTILLSFVGLGLAALYPFMKRYTHLPQLFLGLAFSWAIPMAYSAQGGDLRDPILWMLFVANCFWTIAYDTYYAITDRPDDLKIGIKSTAILFGKQDLFVIVCLQGLTLSLLTWVGVLAELHWPYFVSLILCVGLFYQQFKQAKNRDRDACFRSFLNNNRIGYCVFLGLVISYLM